MDGFKWDWGRFVQGFASKKFLVWVVASVALYLGLIEAGAWLTVTLIYVGANVGQDIVDNRLHRDAGQLR